MAFRFTSPDAGSTPAASTTSSSARLALDALDRLLPLRSRTSSSPALAHVALRVLSVEETFRDLASIARPQGLDDSGAPSTKPGSRPLCRIWGQLYIIH